MTISRGVVLSFGLALFIGTGSPWITLAAPKLPAPASQYRDKLIGTWQPVAESSEKDNPFGVPTFEFKPDGRFKIAMGLIEMSGTYKVVKESGKVVTVEAEVKEGKMGELKLDPTKDKDKGDSKKTFIVTFEDDDTITMSSKDKAAPEKLKRKK